MAPDNRRATISDVAKAAGVSSATVGRALGDYGYVRAEIRDHVRKVADELGYRPNSLAKSMITGRTNTIGVVGADIENPFFASAMRGICDVARREGYGTILTNSDEDASIEREAIQLLLQKQVDGLIVSPANSLDCDHLREAVSSGTPVVLFDRRIAALDADCVIADSVEATRQAVQHLIEAGHWRIAIIAELRAGIDTKWKDWVRDHSHPSPDLLMPSGSRLLGYLKAHWEAGISVDPALIRATGAYDSEQATRQTIDVLELANPPSALFTADNVMTLGAYRAIRQKGLRVPDDISLFAYDDMDWLVFVEPAVSAVYQPVYEMGAKAASALLARLKDSEREPQTLFISTELKIRQSVKTISGST